MSIRTIRDLSSPLFALEGSEVISDTEPHEGDFIRLEAKTDIVISSITSLNVTGNPMDGMALSKGGHIDCQFTSITLASGTAIAIRTSH